MHEMALAEGVLQTIEAAAQQQGFSSVTCIWLEIGELAGVEIESLRFCFDAVTHGSLAEGARLEIMTIPGAGWCTHCAKRVPLHAIYDACSSCGAYQVQVIDGTEMRVKELEVS